jgi:hypothetical protein
MSGLVAFLMASMASSMGIFVKRETTSKLTIISLGSMVRLLIILTSELESVMKELVFPTRG